MKILIAYDGSACGDAALRDLPRAGLPEDAAALVLSAADVWLPDGAYQEQTHVPPSVRHRAEQMRRHAEAELAAAGDRAHAAAAWLQAAFAGWRVEARAVANTPAWAIIEAAETTRADLIVVGSHGKGALDRLTLGSVSQTVAAQAHCSVRVARCRPLDESLRAIRIVIGMDGSRHSEKMLMAVIGRRWQPRAEARVVIALDKRILSADFLDKKAAIESTTEAIMHRIVERATERLESAGIRAGFILREDDPKTALVDEAEAWDADCIFVGARGLSGVERILLGSVSTAVSARAHCSVEIVRG